jgi:LysR family cys regulon transcriptional activator
MEVAGLVSDPAGVVRVGIGQNQLTVLLPSVLRQFHQKYPRICVDLLHGNTPMLINLLRRNQLDLGVISLSDLSRDLKTRPMFTEEMMIVVHKSNHLAQSTELRIQELAGIPLVLYDETMSVGNQIEDFFRQAQFTPNVILRLNSANTLKLMIEKRVGATIAPTSDLLFPPARTPLRAIRIRGSPLERTVALATPPLARLPQVAETLIELLLTESRGMPLLHGMHF